MAKQRAQVQGGPGWVEFDIPASSNIAKQRAQVQGGAGFVEMNIPTDGATTARQRVQVQGGAGWVEMDIPTSLISPATTFRAMVSSTIRSAFLTTTPWTLALALWVPADVTSVIIKIRDESDLDGSSPGGGNFASDIAVGTSAGTTPPSFAAAPTILLAQSIPNDGSEYASVSIPVSRGTDGKILISYTLPTGINIYFEDLQSPGNGGWFSNTGTASAFPLPALANSRFSLLQVRAEYASAGKKIIFVTNSLGEGKLVARDDRWGNLLQTVSGYAVDNTGSMGSTLFDWSPPNFPWLRDTQTWKGATAIIELGVNDVFNGDSAANMEVYFTAIVAYLVAQGVTRIVAFTIPPFTTTHCSVSQTFNAWLQAGRPNVDAVLDTVPLLRSAGDPCVLNAAYDAGDGIHWNAAGNLVIYNAVLPLLP